MPGFHFQKLLPDAWTDSGKTEQMTVLGRGIIINTWIYLKTIHKTNDKDFSLYKNVILDKVLSVFLVFVLAVVVYPGFSLH